MRQEAEMSCHHNHKSNLELRKVNQPFGPLNKTEQNKKREKRFAPTLAQEKNTIKKKKMNHIHKHKCLYMQNQHNATHLVKKIQEVPGPV